MQTAVANCSVSCKISLSKLGMTLDSYLLGLIHSYNSQTAAVVHCSAECCVSDLLREVSKERRKTEVFSPWLNCPNSLRAAVTGGPCWATALGQWWAHTTRNTAAVFSAVTL